MPEGRRFHLIEKLGAGAFGTVYLAELESIGGFRKQVALKILRPELGDTSDAGRRLRDEARMLGRLQHPNIVKVDDLVKLDGRYAVVMEYVTGHDLEVMLEVLEEPLPAPAALQIAELVARALAGAFGTSTTLGDALRLVHRDIKPSNVRVTADGQVKVLDFGIARADFEEREARTERVRYGSIGYMSPERLLGEPETAAGDVYALLAMLYELLIGEAFGRAELAPDPFAEKLEAACARVSAAVEGSLGDEAAEELAALLRRGMAYDADERPDSAELALGLRVLQRKAEGEDLETWAARCVPLADAARQHQREPAEGVLSEQTMAAQVSGSTLVPKNPSATFAMPLDELSGEPPAPPPVPASGTWDTEPTGRRNVPPPLPPDPPLLSPRALGAIAGLLVVLIGAVAFFLMDASTPETPPEPVATQPPPEPVVEPPVAPVVEPPPEDAVVEATPEDGSGEAVVEPPVEPPVEPAVSTSAQTTKSAVTPPTASGDEGAEAPPAEEVEVAAPSGPRLRAVKFTVDGASAVRAVCGDRDASGGSSALVRDLQAGPCVITATVGDAKAETRFNVDRARGVDCALEGTELTCR
ncbi:MAG: serine/threonine protein kinase [Alphaproteobacteria bacterium]|nr:serine/threonine protein kinase [Alphaproteobacteria bacterium]MCB9793896.1 serine/threonine protein kinase [Alphaproteobacteria bacterium]